MSNSYSGGCACKVIRYECSAEPIFSLNCHCRDCQRATGSAYASVRIVPAPAFRIVSGEPRYHRVKSDLGHDVERGFCPDCGSPILGKIAEKPEIVLIFCGSLDDPSQYSPSMDFYTTSAQPWDFMDPALAKYAKGLPNS
ncbi:GFA family protein [Burkholderia ambifaria]|uniref:GFA family protein n=1 Tax=Burkholderia ambifaria TaxID=152480 RepID=UPI00158B6CC9|nr:GFA family protein [Burkholderia ambifaria]